MRFLRRFLYGRYGGDHLGRFLLGLYLLIYLVSFFVRWRVLWLLDMILAFFTLYRMLSRNIPRRQAEEQRYLALTAPLRSRLRTLRMRRTDKVHKYFKCPGCGQQLRVPKGAGHIRVTCRSCGTAFEKKS